MDSKRYYWIKLKTDFFSRDTIDFLLSQNNGCEYVVLYQMLCLNTANNNGQLATNIGEMIVPYDVEKIARDTKYFTEDTIRVALELYKQLGLIYVGDNNLLQIAEFNELVGSETKWAEKKRKQRENNIPLSRCKRLNSEMLLLPSGNTAFVDEKRYGGNGMIAYDLADGKCEMCGSTDNLCIHHNNGYSNNLDDLYILCRNCHAKVESNKGEEIVHRRVHQENRDKRLEYRDKSIDIDDVLVMYEENFGTLSSTTTETIISLEDEYTPKYVKEAMKRAIINNKKSLAYVKGILKQWKHKTWDEIVNENNKGDNPKWFNQEIKKEEVSDEEYQELEDLFKEYKEDKNE